MIAVTSQMADKALQPTGNARRGLFAAELGR